MKTAQLETKQLSKQKTNRIMQESDTGLSRICIIKKQRDQVNPSVEERNANKSKS